ncbi:MAG: WG repeat-containing protein [Clostridiales bacterium]|nr:WG repeat-containing protein [Clostridiales bacterium]
MKKKAIAIVLILCLTMPAAACSKAGFTEAVPPKYDGVQQFSEGMAAVMLDGKWGFIDKAGNEVVPPEYEVVRQFSEGMAAVKSGDWRTGKWGFIDKAGNVAVPFSYDGAGSFSDGLARVTIDGKCGYIDKNGDVAIPLEYDSAGDFSEGLAAVNVGAVNHGFDYTEGGKWGFIDKEGRMVVPTIYDGLHLVPTTDGNLSVDGYHEGFAAVMTIVENKGKWGFIDRTGDVVVPVEYEAVFPFSDGMALIAINIFYDYIDFAVVDSSGTEIVQPSKFNLINNYAEGLAAVRNDIWVDGKWGFIDKVGNEILPFEYDEVGVGFSEGLAAVSVGEHNENGSIREYVGKWGFIDSDGNTIIPMKYDYATEFEEGLAAVNIGAVTENSEGDLLPHGGKWGFIDKKGKEIIPCKYDSVEGFSDGMAAVCLDNKWGYVSMLSH